MGVLVFLLAVVPGARKNGGTGIYLMRAESPGPSVDKLTPHLRQTAMILYGIYILLTALCIVCLLLGGMPVFDSFCIAFGTAGTGGFAIKNSSMGGYSCFLQTVVTVFMFLFGVNFSLYYMLCSASSNRCSKTRSFACISASPQAPSFSSPSISAACTIRSTSPCTTRRFRSSAS